MNDQFPDAGRDRQTSTWSQAPADSNPDERDTEGRRGSQPTDEGPHTGHGSHRWMMIACCIPMVVIVGVLIATGVAGSGLLIYAAICLGAMTLMMFALPGGHKH